MAAQNYPVKPIRVISEYAAGAGGDIFFRPLSNLLAVANGQTQGTLELLRVPRGYCPMVPGLEKAVTFCNQFPLCPAPRFVNLNRQLYGSQAMQHRVRIFLISSLLCVGTLHSNWSVAHSPHRHRGANVHFGVYLGPPVYVPYYQPRPYYPRYYPPVVVAPADPPVYIERAPVQAAPSRPESWWYYCVEARGYYPYVKDCPGSWERVAPQPPNG